MSGQRVVALFTFIYLILVMATPVAAAPAPPETVPAMIQLAQDDQAQEVLPSGLNQILASLGIYILTMFTLALGTEIVVDVVKLGIGLKSKPTARQAMAQFRDLIPGELARLELNAEAEHQFQRHVAAVEELLKPAVRAEDVLVDLHDGHFGSAVQAILGRLNEDGPQTGKRITLLIRDKMHAAVHEVGRELGLNARAMQPVLDRFDQSLDQLAGTDPREVLRWSVTFLQEGMVEFVTTWAYNQKSLLSAGLEDLVRHRYTSVLRPQLVGLGLTNIEMEAIDCWFEIYLTRSRENLNQDVDVYLASLNKLLQGVETQRYLLQSPTRKAWRRFRVAPVIGPLLMGIENGWNRLLGRPTPIYGTPDLPRPITDITEAARIVSDLERAHREESALRVHWLRLTSVFVAIILAYALQIDSADLLAGLLPAPTTNFLSTDIIDAGSYSLLFLQIDLTRHLTAGILLTGLAASAGSSFWHDQLSRMQAVRRASEAAAAVLRQANDTEREK